MKYRWKVQPPLELILDVDVESVFRQVFGPSVSLSVDVKLMGDTKYYTGGEIEGVYDEVDLKNQVLTASQMVAQEAGNVTDFDIVFEPIVQVGEGGVIEYSISCDFTSPVALGVTETVNFGEIKSKALELVKNRSFVGYTCLVSAIDFTFNGYSIKSAKLKFVSSSDIPSDKAKLFTKALLSYVFQNLPETSATFVPSSFDITNFSVSKSSSTVGGILVTSTSRIRFEIYASDKNDPKVKLDATRVQKLVRDLISKIKEEVPRGWDVYLDEMKHTMVQDKNLIQVWLVFEKKDAKADGFILASETKTTVSGVLTTIVILALLATLAVTTSIIVHEIRLMLDPRTNPFAMDFATSLMFFAIGFFIFSIVAFLAFIFRRR